MHRLHLIVLQSVAACERRKDHLLRHRLLSPSSDSRPLSLPSRVRVLDPCSFPLPNFQLIYELQLNIIRESSSFHMQCCSGRQIFLHLVKRLAWQAFLTRDPQERPTLGQEAGVLIRPFCESETEQATDTGNTLMRRKSFNMKGNYDENHASSSSSAPFALCVLLPDERVSVANASTGASEATSQQPFLLLFD